MQPGEFSQTLTLLKQDGALYLKVTRSREPMRWTSHRTDVLALDLVLQNFLAWSEGDLRGIDFIDDLQRYDRQIQRTRRGLQQAGALRNGTCRRYRALITRVRGFLRSNVKRWLWSVLDARRPAALVTERLCFVNQDSGLGWTMNRLLRDFIAVACRDQCSSQNVGVSCFTCKRIGPWRIFRRSTTSGRTG